MTVTKYRRPLNPEQLVVLQWLYQYRFSTSKQLASYLLKPNPKAIQNKLQILEQQGFIGKHYDKSYKLPGRAAEYFLTPKGARQLPADSVNEWALKSLYKNKTVSPDFITHCLNVADTALQLQAIYGDKLGLFTKSHMAAYDYFPSWTPDLFLNLKAGSTRRRYFLDVLDDTKPFFVGVRKVHNYINYAADNDWPDEAGRLPTVLAICKDDQTQKKLNKQIVYALDGAEDITFATTTQAQLEKATATTKLWQKITEDGEPTRMNL
jgi:DNA-binding HxlR family transcriptional regulator